MKTYNEYIKESVTKNYNNFVIDSYFSTDPEDSLFVKRNKEKIYKFFKDGYKNAGYESFEGCDNENSLKKNFCELKIAKSDDKEIAMSIYTSYRGGNKCVGLTITTDDSLKEVGKSAVREIIKTDIKNYNKWYWLEASDAVEALYEKCGAIKIPSKYANLFIGKNEIIDDYHYTRYSNNGKKFTKIIYGFNSEDTFNKICSEIGDDIKKQIDNINSQTMEEGLKIIDKDTFKHLNKEEQCKEIIDIFYYLYNNEGFSYLLKEYINLLKESVRFLKNFCNKNKNGNINNYKLACSYGNIVLDNIEEFKLKEINFYK